MINFFNKRLRDEDRGFTLIELMVVVLIIAILIAIAIPTFLGARKRAQDRAAQTALRSSLTTAKTIYTDSESYSGLTEPMLRGAEPSLRYTEPGAGEVSDDPKLVAWNIPAVTVSGQTTYPVFTAAVRSETGLCWMIYENSASGPTTYGVKTGSCTPSASALAATDKFPPAP
ncbi:MAG TPA: prepilin-type N-terminal cleavage/methylation domain-containing protein [Actinomycetota bacterium]|nr:prepilin-type N-terminal cleavage/methylation domain-containing protein [Actinomycetota bacterium]